MDEDCIYRRIHPEDLVEKRLLEYQFFQKTFSMSSEERLKYRGRCRIRMMNEKGVYQYIDNLVQIMENTPSGSVWLIFCLYTLSADQRTPALQDPRLRRGRRQRGCARPRGRRPRL